MRNLCERGSIRQRVSVVMTRGMVHQDARTAPPAALLPCTPIDGKVR